MIDPNSLKNKLNDTNPNTLADMLRFLGLGSMLRALKVFLRKKAPAASAYQLATLQALVLADDAKAGNITRAYARAGTATAGELAIVGYGVTPGTGQCAVAPNGDIVFLAADAWTSVDVTYQPDKYDVIEMTLPVVPGTGLCLLPVAFTTPGACALLEAEALVGTTTGKKIILVPAAAAVATTKAALRLDKAAVWFAIADAVSSARVKIAVCSSKDVDALLTAVSPV